MRDWHNISHGTYLLEYSYLQFFRELKPILRLEDKKSEYFRKRLISSSIAEIFQEDKNIELLQIRFYSAGIQVDFAIRPKIKLNVLLFAIRFRINKVILKEIPNSDILFPEIKQQNELPVKNQKYRTLYDNFLILSRISPYFEINKRKFIKEFEIGHNQPYFPPSLPVNEEIKDNNTKTFSLRYFIILYLQHDGLLQSKRNFGIMHQSFADFFNYVDRKNRKKFHLINLDLFSDFAILECKTNYLFISPSILVKNIKSATSIRFLNRVDKERKQFPKGDGIWGEYYFIGTLESKVKLTIQSFLQKLQQEQAKKEILFS